MTLDDQFILKMSKSFYIEKVSHSGEPDYKYSIMLKSKNLFKPLHIIEATTTNLENTIGLKLAFHQDARFYTFAVGLFFHLYLKTHNTTFFLKTGNHHAAVQQSPSEPSSIILDFSCYRIHNPWSH